MGLMLGSRPPPHKSAAATGLSTRWVSCFCIASFCFGVLVVNRFWALQDPVKLDETLSGEKQQSREVQPAVKCENKEAMVETGNILSQVSQTHDVIMTLDKTISSLEMQLSAARAVKAEEEEESPVITKPGNEQSSKRPRLFFVMGIITAFSSRKRRNSIRETWMPQGEDLKKLEKEKGIVIRFVIGHSATPGGVLDRAIEAEEEQHKDFLRLNHVEGYHELSSKTQIYFSTAAAKWDADFYVKVDDDVHVNLGMVGSTLARHRSKPRVYIGCMKSGPVLAQKGVKYHEPEYWKFGEEGNKYFRHATGQIYAISKNLATYISVNRHILHRYVNEDVSLGSWFIGLDVEHIDDRSLCCGTAPDCEWKVQAGNPCAASFDWSCSGICKSVERMEEVHQRCGEGDGAIWHTSF
ncbi:LOW QUALITY PROTEIN: beta-1,6-galactosyltransferase GALT31A-like [Actinidia eriantha]|uniref:LOW QUALITY PROTEIN: beta-1,6-galactosyltransferase GALT31A-like n=1 Tax=Actinidia eriantha TaxID=165200 RepID=UPI00258A2C50|nr:LOW QUALITY PROTEIN: beta-1,6-galactosyltransferase GALT31A-like [Actinidia eriantha]